MRKPANSASISLLVYPCRNLDNQPSDVPKLDEFDGTSWQHSCLLAPNQTHPKRAYEDQLLSRMNAGTQPQQKLTRAIIVLAGIVLGQIILYGPSLSGQRVLLPLDLLAKEGFYLPQTPDVKSIQPRDGSLADLVILFEPMRQFAISELQAGRFPMWAPHEFAGVPFNWPGLSPFMVLKCLSKSPVVVAWSQFLLAIIAGTGAYCFFRRALVVSFWPAALCAWCYPLSGFFIFWQGFGSPEVVCWLPWLLLATHRTVSGWSALDPLGLAAVTCLTLSGQLDIAGQVLLASAAYALWVYFTSTQQEQRNPKLHQAASSRIVGSWSRVKPVLFRLSAGWILGFLVVAPYTLSVLDYAHTGARMARRSAGAEERPPVGISAAPQILLPDFYGGQQRPSLRFSGGVEQESAAAGYAGMIAALFVAPLAFADRRRRLEAGFWLLLALLGVSWCLNTPIVVSLLRLPFINMMSHNRLTFLTCFGILAMAAIGLQKLVDGDLRWQQWMWAPIVCLAGLCTWCIYRAVFLPTQLSTELPAIILAGKSVDWVQDATGVKQAQARFAEYCCVGAVLAALGAIAWILLKNGLFKRALFLPLTGVLMVGELLWFAYGRNVQSDPALYYPSLPILQELAKAPAGRVVGYGCLPATLSVMCRLQDIRGYDGVDPARMVDLLLSVAAPASIKQRYAATMQMAPSLTVTEQREIRLPPVLDMLGVRYVIFRGAPFPFAHAFLQAPDYWVLQNARALPRLFVPQRVEVETNDAARLQKLTSKEFDPSEVAYLEQSLPLPKKCIGAARIIQETPTLITVLAEMETQGLVVLADAWNRGWKARVGETNLPILRVNHAVRGVLLPAGSHELEFRYEPQTYRMGCALSGMGCAGLLFWCLMAVRLKVKRKKDLSPEKISAHDEAINRASP